MRRDNEPNLLKIGIFNHIRGDHEMPAMNRVEGAEKEAGLGGKGHLIYDLRFTIYDFRFTIYDLRFTLSVGQEGGDKGDDFDAFKFQVIVDDDFIEPGGKVDLVGSFVNAFSEGLF